MAIPIKRKKVSAPEAGTNATGFREAVAYLQGVADAAAAFSERGSDLAITPPTDSRNGSRLIDFEDAHPKFESLDLPELNPAMLTPPALDSTMAPPSTPRLTLFYGQNMTAFEANDVRSLSLVPITPTRGGARLFEIGTRGRLTLAPYSQRATLPCPQVSTTMPMAAEGPTSDIVPAEDRASGVQLHVPRLAGEWYQLVGNGTWGSWGSTG